jgi:8-oxo-dGTP pyrophosphatase MutT (NUDIX family)
LVGSAIVSDQHRIKVAFGRGARANRSRDMPRAAVATIFRAGEAGTELLFIERATRSGDPWSGHMAFPGGRVDPGDADSHATALRETWEEVGLDLSGAESLGQLDDLHGRARAILVSAHGYWLDGPRPALVANHEVADSMWLPLSELTDPQSFVSHAHPTLVEQTFPGIEIHGGRVIWGLTLRFLADLFGRLDQPFLRLG